MRRLQYQTFATTIHADEVAMLKNAVAMWGWNCRDTLIGPAICPLTGKELPNQLAVDIHASRAVQGGHIVVSKSTVGNYSRSEMITFRLMQLVVNIRRGKVIRQGDIYCYYDHLEEPDVPMRINKTEELMVIQLINLGIVSVETGVTLVALVNDLTDLACQTIVNVVRKKQSRILDKHLGGAV